MMMISQFKQIEKQIVVVYFVLIEKVNSIIFSVMIRIFVIVVELIFLNVDNIDIGILRIFYVREM